MEVQNQKIEPRNIHDGDWYWISRGVLDNFASKIGVIGLALYNVYASYAREKGKAFPSQRTIAEKLGISLKTVRKYNKVLEKHNLIKVESGRKRGRPNIVILLKVKGRESLPTGYESSSHPGGKELPTKENNMKENTIKVDAKASPIDVIDYFKKRVKEVKGFCPEIDYGKDGRLAKERLKKYSFGELKELIDWYLSSENFERFGASLSICLSNFIINLWKASKFGQRSISNLYPLWQGGS
jgi:DNA-binding MarR family transcriptional regulator